MTLFPLVPNWSSGIKENLEYKTDIIVSRDGTEQRRAVRQTPRVTMSYNAIADDVRYRAFERTMTTSLGSDVTLPDYTRMVRTASSMAASANSVTVESVPDWLVADAVVVIQDRGSKVARNIEELVVQSVVGTTITFDSGVTRSYSLGARLRPAMSGRLGGIRSSFITPNVGTVPVNFAVTPGIYEDDTERYDSEGPIPLLNDREVLTLKPNWASSPQMSFDWDVETIDYGFGRNSHFAPTEFGSRILQLTYLGLERSTVDTLRNFFRRRKGSCRDFYVPSFSNDLVALEIFEDGESLKITGTDVSSTYHDSLLHKALSIVTTDGEVRNFEIDVILEGVDDSTIIVTTATGQSAISPSDVLRISWLYVARFASDAVTFEWITDQAAQTVFNMAILPWSEPETL